MFEANGGCIVEYCVFYSVPLFFVFLFIGLMKGGASSLLPKKRSLSKELSIESSAGLFGSPHMSNSFSNPFDEFFDLFPNAPSGLRDRPPTELSSRAFGAPPLI